jgi:V/A-type H+-transporting ATPase subunit I
MIVKMKRFTFVGPSGEKDGFVRRLQDLGATHIALPAEAIEPAQISKELQRVSEIRRFLARLAAKDSESEVSADYSKICSRKEELEKREPELFNRLALLKKEQALLEPWGDFEPEDINFLRSRGLNIGFYKMTNRAFERLRSEGLFCHIARRTEGDTAFVAISLKPIDLDVPEERSPAKSLSMIDKEIEAVTGELSGIKSEYEALAGKVSALAGAEMTLKDDYEYRKVLLNTGSALDDRVFVLTCWSPLPEDELIKGIGEGFAFGHFCEDPEPEDKVPILLSNKPAFDSGEDLVRIYSYPGYRDIDPSGIVLYAFAALYGLIIGDAGYGLVYLALTGLLHWKVKSRSPLWIRFRRLSYILACAVIFWGIITGSYFGISLDADNPLNKAMLINMVTKEGQTKAMLFSIILGMIHLSIALGIKFYRTRNIASIGWIAVMWSGYALIYSKKVLGVGNPAAACIFIAGLIVVILFISDSRNPITRIGLGLYEGGFGLAQLFSDILSYLRVFALGLATMYICMTFNMLASMPYKALPYIGIIPAVFILIFGHGINLALGIMGGVVHGLRLNFLEWYRWCFEGDGVAFKPFKRNTVKA